MHAHKTCSRIAVPEQMFMNTAREHCSEQAFMQIRAMFKLALALNLISKKLTAIAETSSQCLHFPLRLMHPSSRNKGVPWTSANFCGRAHNHILSNAVRFANNVTSKLTLSRCWVTQYIYLHYPPPCLWQDRAWSEGACRDCKVRVLGESL